MKKRQRMLPNPGKKGWFAIGATVGIGATIIAASSYVFWKMTKM